MSTPVLSVSKRLALLLPLLGALTVPRAADAGSTITVNTTNDSDSIDGELSLREALEAAGAGGLHCLTDAEKNQISGANFVLAPVNSSCLYNPLTTSRWVFNGLDPNVGSGYHDEIVFAGGIGDTITVDPARSGSGLHQLWTNDYIDGALPGGGKMRLLG